MHVMRLLLIPWFLLPALAEANDRASLHLGDPPAAEAAVTDGGVINAAQTESGDGRWRVARTDGQLHWYLERGHASSASTVPLVLDFDGPAIQLTWSGAAQPLTDKTIVGPQTKPMAEVNDGSGVAQVRYVMDSDVTVSQLPSPLPADLSRIDLVATDRLGNSARKTVSLLIDDEGPNINIELLNRLDNNPEFSHFPAQLRIAIDDEHVDVVAVEPDVLTLAKTQDLRWQEEGIAISSVDALGNTSSERRQWRYDTHGPVATIEYDGATYSHRETVHLKRGDSVTFSVTDEGAGLEQARYRYNRRSLRELPESLVFADRGAYVIRAFLVDKLGNESQQQWRVIAK